MEDPDSVVNDTAEQFEQLRKFVEVGAGWRARWLTLRVMRWGERPTRCVWLAPPRRTCALRTWLISINPAFSKLIVDTSASLY